MLDFWVDLDYNKKVLLCSQYSIKTSEDKDLFTKNSKMRRSFMSKQSKKLWVRVVCGCLALLMVASCAMILAPIF